MFKNIFSARYSTEWVMRYSKQHKQATKQKIIRNANALFTAKGFDGTSIEEIMRSCALTRGGFYAHFRSKAQLYREAIKLSAVRRIAPITDENKWIETLLSEYLDSGKEHETSNDRWAFFASDLASENPEVRSAYAIAFKAMSEKILGRMGAQFGLTEESSYAIAAMLIGAAAVARTIDDDALKTKLLASCKKIGAALIENKSAVAPLSFFWERERLDPGAAGK
jgi:TetR/AcrR family transcriptional regulator, transcriptional repressor for nem operon